MKIENQNGEQTTSLMRNIKAGDTFRFPAGTNIYLMTDYRSSQGGRLYVSLNVGSYSFEEACKCVVPIKNIKVVVNDPNMVVDC